MKISVIIPCYQRPDWLRKTLASVLEQKTKQDEIIVIYQAIEPDSDLENWCDLHQIIYRYSNTPSTPLSRNIGIAKANGDICVFFDDDVELHPGCLEAHRNSYKSDEIAGVSGRVVTMRDQGPDMVKPSVKEAGRVTNLAKIRGDQNYNSLTRFIGNTTPLGCNMSFRRQSLIDIGSFDGVYRGNAMREETDVAVRILRKGGKIVFEPKAAVTHYLAKKGGSRAKSKANWYADFFFNSTYFIKKFTHPVFFPIAILSLLPFLAKYYIRHCRSFREFIVPFIEVSNAVSKVERNV